MSLSAVIDTAIGLVFVYLLVSLFVTAIQEVIANIFQRRGDALYGSLKSMLEAGAGSKASNALTESKTPGEMGLLQGLQDHSLVRSLIQGTSLLTWFGNIGKFPSYLPTGTFTSAVLDLLNKGSDAHTIARIKAGIEVLPSGRARDTLNTLLRDAGDDLGAFRKSVGQWFDDTMERASGAYKKRAQLVSLLIGMSVAVALNINSLEIAKTLWQDPVVRAEITARGAAWIESEASPAPPAESADPGAPASSETPVSLEDAKKALDNLRQLESLPFGWSPDPAAPIDWLSTVIGWLLTGLAVSLGAPFWFDTLGRIVNLRASGPKPAPVAT